MNILKGKWALVTGASRGVGLRVAKALGNEGCRLLLHSRKLEGTLKIAEDFNTQGVEAYCLAAELGQPEMVEALVKDVMKITEQGVDILYNNAAIMTTYRDIYTPTIDEYARSFMVNTIAPAKLCDAFIPGMITRGWGRVVNVTSGIADQPQLMAYSCSKAALARYVRDMIPTLEGTGVIMSLMDPGWLRTDLGGPKAPNDPDSVLPGAMVPVLLPEGSKCGVLYCAQDYAKK